MIVYGKSGSLDDLALYDDMKEYVLSEEKLIENNYPVRHPEKPGCAILFVDNKKATGDRELISLGSRFAPRCKVLPHFNCVSWCLFCWSKLSRGSAVAVVLRTL